MIKYLYGDCLVHMKDIPDNSIDFCLTDPPYGTTACKWDSVIPFEPMWKELKRIVKDNGAIALFGTEPFSSHLRMSNLKMYKYDWVWVKNQSTGFLNSNRMPMKDNEYISIFYKKQTLYNIQYRETKANEDSLNRYNYKYKEFKRNHNIYGKEKGYPAFKAKKKVKATNTLFFNAIGFNSKDRKHPTQKPVALLEYLIKTYTNENETVLDFTMGSGSTGIACINLNRNFIGIEKELKYYQIAKERIEKRIKEKDNDK